MNTIQFKQWPCTVHKGHYQNGQNALYLLHAEGGDPIAKCSVALDVEIPENHVLIKDWSENEGMLETLEKAGIVKPIGKEHPTGFVVAHECELLI